LAMGIIFLLVLLSVVAPRFYLLFIQPSGCCRVSWEALCEALRVGLHIQLQRPPGIIQQVEEARGDATGGARTPALIPIGPGCVVTEAEVRSAYGADEQIADRVVFVLRMGLSMLAYSHSTVSAARMINGLFTAASLAVFLAAGWQVFGRNLASGWVYGADGENLDPEETVGPVATLPDSDRCSEAFPSDGPGYITWYLTISVLNIPLNLLCLQNVHIPLRDWPGPFLVGQVGLLTLLYLQLQCTDSGLGGCMISPTLQNTLVAMAATTTAMIVELVQGLPAPISVIPVLFIFAPGSSAVLAVLGSTHIADGDEQGTNTDGWTELVLSAFSYGVGIYLVQELWRSVLRACLRKRRARAGGSKERADGSPVSTATRTSVTVRSLSTPSLRLCVLQQFITCCAAFGPWDRDPSKPPAHHFAVVTTHFNEDMGWVTPLMSGQPGIRLYIYECGVHPLPLDVWEHPNVTVVNKSGPLANTTFFYTFMDFVERRYDKLPTYTLFLHAHDVAYHRHASIAQTVRMCYAISLQQSVDYVNVGDAVVNTWYSSVTRVNRCRTMSSRVRELWPDVRSLLDEQPSEPPPLRLLELFGAEALVHRCRLLLRPRSTWARLRDTARALTLHAPLDLVFEGMFHHTMGEPWVRPFLQKHRRRISSITCTKSKNRHRIGDRERLKGVSELELRYRHSNQSTSITNGNNNYRRTIKLCSTSTVDSAPG